MKAEDKFLAHPYVTDPVKPDPVDFFLFHSENFLASPVPGEICNFTRPVCGFPGAILTYPAYIIFVCLKKVKQRPGRKGQPGGQFADTVMFYSRKPGENIDATGVCYRGLYWHTLYMRAVGSDGISQNSIS